LQTVGDIAAAGFHINASGTWLWHTVTLGGLV
jgi:hypothetical protein